MRVAGSPARLGDRQNAPRRAPRGFAVFCALSIALLSGLIATAGPSTTTVPALSKLKSQYRRPATVPYPADNARTPAREHLGRALFFDPRLSRSSAMSCASCHNPAFSWGDGLALGVGDGMQQLGRRTPTILNLAWAPALFWDGRADSLEEQALGPIASPKEMNLDLDTMVARLQGIRGSRELFARAYPGEGISARTVGKALATFQRGVISGDAPFDRWIAGDERALSSDAVRGFVLFNTKARCSTCHTGWRFTDDGFYDIGVAGDDLGRGKIVPAIALARNAFKTPTLRNVGARAPYLHNGSASTLEEVVDLYDRGGLAHRPSLSPEIKALGLTPGEKKDLVAFLLTLTSQDVEARIPALPR
jgi:cytochrome c peroxidase